MSNVWRLGTTSNKSRVLRSDIDYFTQHFIGKRMTDNWHPPEIRQSNTSKKTKDFLSWMLCAPVISERAMHVLKPLIGSFVEFLPLIILGKVQYHAVNVLCRIKCLDLEHSNVVYSPTDNRIIDVFQYQFLETNFADFPIFILEEFNSPVFVTQSFLNLVLQEKLTGAQFCDPAANQYKKLLNGLPLNVVEGVIE